MNAQIFSINDLNTTINHEPRLQDLLLAEKLGMKDKHKIREIIETYKTELETWGEIVSAQERKPQGGRPSQSYYLTKKQALFICTKARTEKASEITIALVEVYDSYSQDMQPSLLELPSNTINSSEQQTLRELIQKRVTGGGVTYPEAWERLKRKFRVAKYEQITREQLAEVIAYVCAMEPRQKALPNNDNGEYCSVNKEQLLWVLNLPLHIQQETCLLDGIDFSKSSGKILMRRLTDKIDGYLKGYSEKSMEMLCAADPIFARTMRGLDAVKAQAA